MSQAHNATARAMSHDTNIDFHFERNSSCPWYIIIYPAHIVIINTESAQKTSISLLSISARILSTVPLLPLVLSIRFSPHGVIFHTLISKLELVIHPVPVQLLSFTSAKVNWKLKKNTNRPHNNTSILTLKNLENI